MTWSMIHVTWKCILWMKVCRRNIQKIGSETMIKIPHVTMWHICVIRGFSFLFLFFFRLQSSMVQVTLIDLFLVFIFYLISSSFKWMSFWIEIKPCDIWLAGLFFSFCHLWCSYYSETGSWSHAYIRLINSDVNDFIYS